MIGRRWRSPAHAPRLRSKPPRRILAGMSGGTDNLVLEMLRAIRGDLAELKSDMAEVKERLGLLEAQYASVSRRLDRLGGDVEHIKRRLDLADHPAG